MMTAPQTYKYDYRSLTAARRRRPDGRYENTRMLQPKYVNDVLNSLVLYTTFVPMPEHEYINLRVYLYTRTG